MPQLAPEIAARSLSGCLRLRAVADGNAITRLIGIERSAPMQVQRLLYEDSVCPGLATAHIINATAGLFAGDDLRLTVEVSGGARLAVSTPTATRVYAMPAGGVATAIVDLRVRAGGYLEYLPSPTILCAAAALRQEADVALAGSAHAAIGEVWVFGRAAHDELHAYRELDARMDLRRGGSLISAEALVLRPGDDEPDGALGAYAAYGTLALVGPRADAELLAGVRRRIGARGGLLAGASMLRDDAGIAVRVLGASAFAICDALKTIAVAFRRHVLASDEVGQRAVGPREEG